jgi:hypothetical protein
MISASVSTPARRQRRAKRKVTRTAEIAEAQKNQTPPMPSVPTNPVMEMGVSMEKFVAAMETPMSHQGMPRPPTKKFSTDSPAFFVRTTPIAKTMTRYATMTA